MPFSVPCLNPTLFYKTHPIIMGLFRQDFPLQSTAHLSVNCHLFLFYILIFL